MGCCEEKLKIERLKDIAHANVLACQEANITNRTIAVVKLIHKDYGQYYQGLPIEKTKSNERLRVFRPGDTMKPKPKPVTKKVTKKKAAPKKKKSE